MEENLFSFCICSRTSAGSQEFSDKMLNKEINTVPSYNFYGFSWFYVFFLALIFLLSCVNLNKANFKFHFMTKVMSLGFIPFDKSMLKNSGTRVHDKFENGIDMNLVL